jgi:hypothetical protein
MTPHAVLLGLMGNDPESVEVGRLGRVWDEVKDVGEIVLGIDGDGVGRRVRFSLDRDLVSQHGFFVRRNIHEVGRIQRCTPAQERLDCPVDDVTRISSHGSERNGCVLKGGILIGKIDPGSTVYATC